MRSFGDEDLARAAVRGARVSLTGWARGPCPFCVAATGKPDRHNSFGLRTDGRWNCFKCGSRGRLRDGVDPEPREPEVPAGLQAVEPPDGFFPLWEGPGLTAATMAPARDYALERLGSPTVLREARVGACASGRAAGRVVVPILADDGSTWLGWVGRAWARGDGLKYLYPRGMARGTILYRRLVLDEESDVPAIVVEGVLDALCPAVWPRGVALLGKASGWQVAELAAARRPVVVVLDGDAHEEGWALALKLRLLGVRAGSVRLPPRVDPDEVPAAWLAEEARRCIDA